jgi:uncharacterized protein (DUF1778 family)
MAKPGPKPLYGEAAAGELRIRLTPKQKQRLEEAARLNMTSVSAFVREAIDSSVADFSDVPVFHVIEA